MYISKTHSYPIVLLFAIKMCTGFTTADVIWITRNCAVSLANHLRVAAESFRRLRTVWHPLLIAPWCSGYHDCTASFKKSLNSGSAQVQILLAACRRFSMVSDNDPWSLISFVGQPYHKNNSHHHHYHHHYKSEVLYFLVKFIVIWLVHLDSHLQIH